MPGAGARRRPGAGPASPWCARAGPGRHPMAAPPGAPLRGGPRVSATATVSAREARGRPEREFSPRPDEEQLRSRRRTVSSRSSPFALWWCLFSARPVCRTTSETADGCISALFVRLVLVKLLVFGANMGPSPSDDRDTPAFLCGASRHGPTGLISGRIAPTVRNLLERSTQSIRSS
jgi:hypothetical protein